jgi:hypothetical protein
MSLAQPLPAICKVQSHCGPCCISIPTCDRLINVLMFANQSCLVLLWIAVSQQRRVKATSSAPQLLAASPTPASRTKFARSESGINQKHGRHYYLPCAYGSMPLYGSRKCELIWRAGNERIRNSLVVSLGNGINETDFVCDNYRQRCVEGFYLADTLGLDRDQSFAAASAFICCSRICPISIQV